MIAPCNFLLLLVVVPILLLVHLPPSHATRQHVGVVVASSSSSSGLSSDSTPHAIVGSVTRGDPTVSSTTSRASPPRRTTSTNRQAVRQCAQAAERRCKCVLPKDSNCLIRTLKNVCDEPSTDDREAFRRKVRRRYRTRCHKHNGNNSTNSNSSITNVFGNEDGSTAGNQGSDTQSMSAAQNDCLKQLKDSCNCGLVMKGSNCLEQTYADSCNLSSQSMWKEVRQAYNQYCETP